MMKSVEMMEKVTRERERLQDGRILSMPTIITAPKCFISKRVWKSKINLLQWAGQKCNEGKLTKLQMDGREEAQKKAEHFFCD